MNFRGLVLALLTVLQCASVQPVWAQGSSLVLPPEEIEATIQSIDRPENRLVLVERNLEVFATNPRQLDGLSVGQKVRLRYQQQSGKPIILIVAPLPK